MNVDPGIFKAYDIRGIYPTQLDETGAYAIARGYATLLAAENPGKPLNIVVARDARQSSPQLFEQTIKGITDTGLNVIDAGLLSTPDFYFAVGFYGYDGGVQVSASHNPPEWNGFKMVRAQAVPISGDSGIQTIRQLVESGKFAETDKKGSISKKTGVVEEMVRVQKQETDWPKIKPFKIVIDTGNGMGGPDVEEIFKDLPCQLLKMFFEMDGRYPNHIPNPLDDNNNRQIREKIIAEKADLGIAIDGDADRYFFLDENGVLIKQEIIRGIMAQIELKEHPGAVVGYDIRPGKITKDMILAAGGIPLITKVGHSLIKEAMIKAGAIFGGESSGHYFYKHDYGTFETPAVLTLKFLRYISDFDLPVSQIIKQYDKYFHSGEINSEVANPTAKIAEIEQNYSDGEISHLDGITIEYPNFWFNVRPSNTESKLRLNLEAVDKKTMEEKRDEVLALIRA